MKEFNYKEIKKELIDTVLPLVYELNEEKISMAILKDRFNEMIHQNYKCFGVYDNNQLIGVTGVWFCTRHYSGKSAELDHVFIKPQYRGSGLGKAFMKWIYNYLIELGYESIELNTYVQNYDSHKFYYNEGYKIFGYHFVKKL